MMPKRIFLPALLLAALLIYISCRKIDREDNNYSSQNIESKFFTAYRSADPLETSLVNFIKRENDKKHFVDRIVKQIGFPHWDKAIKQNAKFKNHGRGTSDSAYVVYVPFARDSQNYVNATMVIHVEPGDTTFSYLCDWQYAQLYNSTTSVTDTAEYFAAFFMMLDNAVFGHKSFNITDSNLFKSNNSRAYYVDISDSFASGRNNLLTPITVCTDFTVYFFVECPYPNSVECMNGCDHCIFCMDHYSYDYCWEEYVDDGSGGGNPCPGTGGGGGGNGDPPPCPGGGTARTDQITDPCQPGWEPNPGGGGHSEPDPCAKTAWLKTDSLFKETINEFKIRLIENRDTQCCISLRGDE